MNLQIHARTFISKSTQRIHCYSPHYINFKDVMVQQGKSPCETKNITRAANWNRSWSIFWNFPENFSSQVEAFSLAAFASVEFFFFNHMHVILCSCCFWRRRSRLQSWDFGVFSLTLLIAIRSCFKQIVRRKSFVLAKRSITESVWYRSVRMHLTARQIIVIDNCIVHEKTRIHAKALG